MKYKIVITAVLVLSFGLSVAQTDNLKQEIIS